MKQRLASVLVLALAVCLLAPLAASGAPTPSGRLVVVVLVPYMKWGDVVSGSMPVLENLAREGAVGLLNVRSDLRNPPMDTPVPAALALSAGAPAVADESALAAFGADEHIASSDAAQAYRRMMGRGLSGARIAYLGLPVEIRANADSSVETRLGSLGRRSRTLEALQEPWAARISERHSPKRRVCARRRLRPWTPRGWFATGTSLPDC